MPQESLHEYNDQEVQEEKIISIVFQKGTELNSVEIHP